MIGLSFVIENIDLVLQIYDQVQIIRYDTITINPPETPIGQPEVLMDWTVVSGTIEFPVPISLLPAVDFYQIYDPYGEAEDWYSSRYYDSITGSYSAWSPPILGGEGDLYYDPIYPPENSELTVEEKAIIKRIRIYIGDPVGLKREYGEEALASIHPDGKVFELSEKGWPVYITMGGKGFTDKFNPSVNGYRYLKFQQVVNDACNKCIPLNTVCGDAVEKNMVQSVDIWYYTFRNSDRQILEAYDSCPPPPGLTSATSNSQAYMLQTAIDLLQKELLEDASEDGAVVKDEGTSYDPSSGLRVRKELLDGLKKQLKDVVNSLMLKGITGVLID